MAALPEPVELAVIATPAAAVTDIAEDCGQRGVKALVVTAVGLDAAARARLLAICRRYGMRLVGPTSFGVANMAAALDATFAARQPRPGRAGLALQSGGVGIVLLEHLSRLGVGISSFVSLGDKADVSGNDMLLWWASDPATKLAVLYLDSFGNPRKFARTARAVGRTMPVLTVSAGRSVAGQRLAAIRAAAAAAPQLTRQALFEQAGVIATANLGELLDATVLLAAQPTPAGGRVGVVANTRGGDGRAGSAWRCSPAASASSCSSTCPGWASGSPRSSPWATRTTCPATTCCCGGSRTRRPSWPCCTWTRSGTRVSSPGPRGPSAALCPCWPSTRAGRRQASGWPRSGPPLRPPRSSPGRPCSSRQA